MILHQLFYHMSTTLKRTSLPIDSSVVVGNYKSDEGLESLFSTNFSKVAASDDSSCQQYQVLSLTS